MSIAAYLQFLLSGLTVGSTYGLTALGFTIIYNTTGIVNFAQGEFVMLGGMFGVWFLHLGLPLPLALVLAVAATTLAGGLMERLTIRPVQNAPVLNLIIVTIGVSIFVRGLVQLAWGKDTHILPAFTGSAPIMAAGAAVQPQSLWVLGITLALLLGLKRFFSGTLWGKAMTACAFDRKAAFLAGIAVRRMVLLSFMISAAVGAVGGVILTPLTMTSYDVGIMLGLKGFAAAVLGGLGNPFGAAVGGLILGVLESFGAGLVSSAYKDAFSFVILLLLLFLKPSGLFGRSSSERV
ncbi:ABC-type transporter, integral membrane subunit [Desulfovibrio sp. X2]|uniref:branched-chain amino acid ABC transporter permease n=1 Tax=Desulfovibrio sp. X2 TaxID=941449 RepID=UPI000358D546|nr:branched-chain amino acid ABC transporter permease [Desulfovibrio sp. X2]EPR41925.1 ABC-type transporter, integral membrane subunit [Desulfovibrio sp. X2]